MSNFLKFNFRDDNDYEYDEEEESQEIEEEELKDIHNYNEESCELSIKEIKEKKIEINKINKSESEYYINSKNNKENLEIRNDEENIEFNSHLRNIIDKDKITNTIIISKNVFFINIIKENIINFNILKNKKICYLVIEPIKAKNIYNSFNDKGKIKPLLMHKNNSKKMKNEYPNFRNQIKNSNLFILNPNILYKLSSIGFIKISDFGLILFDDCHLCDGNHNYNNIMQEFYFYYINEKINIELPNIIGFTNSLFKDNSDKSIILNKNKSGQILKNISENLNCQILVDPTYFSEKKENEENECNIEYIKVENYLKEKNKLEGINLILFKFFFEDMLNLYLKDYIKMYGETKELNNENIIIIKKKYLNLLKEKYISENFDKYNNIESKERSLHFLSQKSIFFKIFEEMQKYLINIIQNIDLEEIYLFFVKYNNLYEENYEKIKNKDQYLQKIYKKMIIIFGKCIHGFKRLMDKNIEYNTDRINKFIIKLNDIYNKNKNSKILIFVPNRKIANILYNYLNRNKKENYFKNKSKFIVGSNTKKEENSSLTLTTRTTISEIKQRIKEYNENKINILICTPSTLEYLGQTFSDYIIIFTDLSNTNNGFNKVKSKSKICNSNLIIFTDKDKKDDKTINEKDLEKNELKSLFLEGDKIKNLKDFKDLDFINNKRNDKLFYYYISETEAKLSLKNCMMIFNEINNLFISKGMKIIVEKKTENYKDKEQQFICYSNFNFKNENVTFTSRIYNDKQSAENECYMKYIIYLHQKKLIDNNFQVLI